MIVYCLFLRIIKKIHRFLWLLFHFYLLNKKVQINGIPTITSPNNLVIGKNVSFNDNVYIQCAERVAIGNNVTFSYGSSVFTNSLSTDNYIEGWHKKYREHVKKEVIIEDGCWIAANCTILPGSFIAEGSIVAAGSVVRGKLKEKNALYGGIPAKFIKYL